MAYNVFDPRVNKPLHELTRNDSQDAYDWFIKNIPERIAELTSLVNNDGIELDFTKHSLIMLHDWFFDVAHEEYSLKNQTPSPELFSVCNDIGIYIAEMIKKDNKSILWNLYTNNSKDISYQRPVLVGFNVKNNDYHIDIDYLICQYAHRILKKGTKEDNLFLNMYEKALSII